MKFAPNNNHMMLDIETLGTKPGSVVLSVGAVKFDPCFVEPPLNYRDKDRVFYVNIDKNSSERHGMTSDPATIKWWDQQVPAAQMWLTKPEPVSLTQACFALKCWAKGTKFVWANGATFDFVLLKDAFDRAGLDFPWHYRTYRCMRTLYEIARRFEDLPDWPDSDLPKHAAHGDAIRQTWGVQRMMLAIANGGKTRKPW